MVDITIIQGILQALRRPQIDVRQCRQVVLFGEFSSLHRQFLPIGIGSQLRLLDFVGLLVTVELGFANAWRSRSTVRSSSGRTGSGSANRLRCASIASYSALSSPYGPNALACWSKSESFCQAGKRFWMSSAVLLQVVQSWFIIAVVEVRAIGHCPIAIKPLQSILVFGASGAGDTPPAPTGQITQPSK